MGYAMSHVLIKPYTLDETLADPTKAEFNTAHSRLRTVMTENIYGQLTGRFPVLKNTRTHFPLSQKIIVVCCMLHNMAKKWKEEDAPPNDPCPQVQPLRVPQGPPVDQQLGPLEAGKRIREHMRIQLGRRRI